MKTKGLLFITCLAAGALIASPAQSKPAKKSAGSSSQPHRMATRTTQMTPNYRQNRITRSQIGGTRYYSGGGASFAKPPIIFSQLSKKIETFDDARCLIVWTNSYFAMNNSKLFVSAICILGFTLAAPLSTEAGRIGASHSGGGGHAAAMASCGGFAGGGCAPGGYG